VHLESVDPWYVSLVGSRWDESRVDLEDDIVERSTKVGTVNGGVAGRFGVVKIFTFGAVQFDSLDIRIVGLAHRKERVCLAHYSGTFAEVAFLVFLKLYYMLTVASLRS
jgi:hypothetical protein